MASCNCADRERHDWFKMSPGAFFASDTVVDSEPWEVQCFLHMLMLSWQGPGLPADRRRLARRLGVTPERVDELLSGPVGDKWEECCGKLWNANQEALRDEAQARRESYKDRGRKGGKASGKSRAEEAAAKQGSSSSQAVAKQQPSNSEATASKNEATAKHQLSKSQAAAKLSEPEEKRREESRDSLRESPPNPPVGGSSPEPKVQRGRLVPAQLQMLAVEFSLPPDAVTAFEDWRVYRIEIGKQLTQSSARKLAKRAAKDPAQFVADVEHSIEVASQGLYAKKSGGAKGEQFVSARVETQRANAKAAERLRARAAEKRAGSARVLDAGAGVSQSPWTMPRAAGGEPAALPAPRDVNAEEVA